MLKIPKVSIITPTHNRHSWLISCIEQVKNQDTHILFEHIVVSDGVDEQVVKICDYYKIRCACIEKEVNNGTSKGHKARDVGISMATGQFILLWDDDNIYYRNAISLFISEIKNYDILVCNIRYRVRRPYPHLYKDMPENWNGQFVKSNIDTMNVMVKSQLAKTMHWTNSSDYAGDYYWLKSLENCGAKIGYCNEYVGIKN